MDYLAAMADKEECRFKPWRAWRRSKDASAALRADGQSRSSYVPVGAVGGTAIRSTGWKTSNQKDYWQIKTSFTCLKNSDM